MYDALRKYYKSVTGRSLGLPDHEITSRLKVLQGLRINEVVKCLQIGFTAFSYSPSLFKDIRYVSDADNYPLVKDKLLPSIAFSVAQDENTTWTLEDLHVYLVDGITVGGHTIQEQAIVDGVRNAYNVLGDINSGYVDKFDICSLHSILMRDLIRDITQIGCIRSRPVSLFGVPEWKSIPVELLHDVFFKEVQYVNQISDTLERAIIAMLWLQYRQFFLDGNKRVSRFTCNAILGAQSIGVFCVPAQHIRTYQKLLAEFYKTANADNIIQFTLDHCLVYFPDDRTTHWPN